MPIFDFYCRRCGIEFESIVLGESPDVQCPACGGREVLRKAVYLFNCTEVQLTKRLKMESEEQLRKGQEMLKREGLRRKRIRIL
jgi:putative FmdB family regulatory protein